MEVVDAQIHEPRPALPLDDSFGDEVKTLVNVELAREAIDSVGIDAALVFASQTYIDACLLRYPDRFAGALTFDYMAEDLEEQIATFRATPGMVAGRNLVGNANTAELRPEFEEGKFERLYTFAESRPPAVLFHAWLGTCSERVAHEHPGLRMVVDHLGVSQSPVSPPRPEP